MFMQTKKSKSASYEIDMTSGPIFTRMLLFALPLMASSILQLLFNAADIIVVGRFAGDNSMGAVGSTSSLIALLTNFFLGLSVGVNVMISRYHGAGERDNVRDTVQTSIMTSLVGGIVIGLVGAVGSAVFLRWMGSPDEVIGLATLYLRIYFLGMPAIMVYNFGSAVLRAIGDTRRPLVYLTLSGIINVILNLIFVIALQMDVAGVATATVISQCISACLVVRCLTHESGEVHLDLRKLRIHRSKLAKILQIGLPAGLQSMLFNLSNVMIQSSINSFGAQVVAGSSAASNLEGFVYMSMNAFYQADLSFTSQNVGAAKYKRISRIMRCALISVFVDGLLVGLLFLVNATTLLGFYTSSEAVIALGLDRLRIILPTYFLCGMMDVVVGTLRGLGYAVMPMVVSLVGICGLRLIWIFTFFRMPRFHTVESLYMNYPVTWIITLTAHLICYMVVRRRKKKEWGC